MQPIESAARSAAYGFRIEGLPPTPALALTAAEDWPRLRVGQVVDRDPGPEGAIVRDEWGSIRTPAGRLVLDRRAATVTIHAPQQVPVSDLVHPGLWPAAAVFARWRGAETLHAGLLIAPGDTRAWAVVAESGAGKSSILAHAALAGCDVLVDDLVVIEGRDCYAGPRCIDLRPEATETLSGREGVALTPVRSTQRRRLALGPSVGRATLAGFVHLSWGARTSIERLAPHEALAVLAHHRRVNLLGVDAEHILELAGLPMLRLCRRRNWESVEADLGALLGEIASLT